MSSGSSGSSDELERDELVPVGGTWSALLFENPVVACPLVLTWTFTIDFAEVGRDFGAVSPSLSIDWVPATTGWRDLVGCRFESVRFAEPVESSIYFFQHYRYEGASVDVTAGSDSEIDVRVHVFGDLDGLGLPRVETETRLRFAGIIVQTAATGSDIPAATALLAQFTDVSGLHAVSRAHNVVFSLPPTT